MKPVEEFLISSVSELEEVARQLLNFGKNSSVWAFYGEMGAGKTTFIREICKQLGVNENVSSPTFSIINEYTDSKGKPVFHFDFYRIEKTIEAVNIGCEEYFESGSLCLVEWPEKILNLLPHPYVKITIGVEHTNRRISFSYE